jgi:hypothetical protein
MISSMISACRRTAVLTLCVLFAFCAGMGFADVRHNPYTPIVERNVFGLRPPPVPGPETNQTTVTPPAKVVLTGITSMFGPNSKRAFFEITQQEPGKQATAATPKRPILGEGDREGEIEVLSIDIDHNIVKIRNGTVESELTFEVPKSGGSGSSGGAGSGANLAANLPGVNPPAPPPTQPTIISSSEPRGGVTMLGGGGGFAGNSAGVTSFGGSTPMASGSSGGISSFGGLPATGGPGFAGAGNPALAAAGGLPTIPNRPVRTPPPETQQIDPVTQQILMEANRMRYEQGTSPKPTSSGGSRPPLQYPPLPPTAISQHLNASGPPPLPGTR